MPESARVSPTDRIRGEIDALFDGSREIGEIIEDVARLGVRLIIQTAVEAEVDVFLGRARYQRAADCPDAILAGRADRGLTEPAAVRCRFGQVRCGTPMGGRGGRSSCAALRPRPHTAGNSPTWQPRDLSEIVLQPRGRVLRRRTIECRTITLVISRSWSAMRWIRRSSAVSARSRFSNRTVVRAGTV